jgi:hypothetical protein
MDPGLQSPDRIVVRRDLPGFSSPALEEEASPPAILRKSMVPPLHRRAEEVAGPSPGRGGSHGCHASTRCWRWAAGGGVQGTGREGDGGARWWAGGVRDKNVMDMSTFGSIEV